MKSTCKEWPKRCMAGWHIPRVDRFQELSLPCFREPITVERSDSMKESEMNETGRLYSREFEEDAVRLVHSSEDLSNVVEVNRGEKTFEVAEADA